MTSRAWLLLAIGVGVGAVAAVVSQSTSPGAPPAALRTQLQSQQFMVVTSIRGLPLDVRGKLQSMFGGTLDIAEPGADFQKAGSPSNSQLPKRQLIAAGCSKDSYCLVYYELGGSTRAWRVALFHWTPALTRFEWGGTASGGLTTIDDVRKAIVSGAINAGRTDTW